MFAACIANNKKKRRMNEKLNHLGIDVGKRKCRAAIKEDKGKILDEFFFGNDANGISDLLSKVKTNSTTIILPLKQY
jgi:activator of 2-hydroxyglutaryl-CoA dehydratase